MFRLAVGLIASISIVLPALADEEDSKRRLEVVFDTAE